MATPLERQLAALRARIREVDPESAVRDQHGGAVLLDVREPEETGDGHPPGATLLPRGLIETRIEERLSDRRRPVRTLCATGVRSLLAAGTLLEMGYTDVANVSGGFEAWKTAGLPVHRPTGATARAGRYQRQVTLPEVGQSGQERLAAARVLIVGAGGLGSPAALYLAGAGVGMLGLADGDTVEFSNLHRQPLHTEAAVGMPKVESARLTLQARNADITVTTHAVRVDADNAADLVRHYDLVLDCTDNFAARYALSDACAAAGRPLIQAAILRFEGQLTVLHPAAGGPCYRCLYPEPPPPEIAPSCGEAGVLGVVPGHMGTIQAAEALKLILGIGEPLVGRLLCVDLLTARSRRLEIQARPGCPGCSGAHPEAAAR